MKDVEALGKKLGFTQADKNFHNVSLGQGQEVVAESAMQTASRGIYYIDIFLSSLFQIFVFISEGHWVILVTFIL